MSVVVNRDINEVCDASPDPPRSPVNRKPLNKETNKPKINEKKTENNETPSSNNSSTNCDFNSTGKPKTKTFKYSKQKKIPKGVVYICKSSGVNIGDSTSFNINNVMSCNNNGCRSPGNKKDTTNLKEMPPYVKTMSASYVKITETDMLLIKEKIGENWEEFAKCLNYSKLDIDEFSELSQHNRKETVYKILVDWKQFRGKEATINTIISALWASKEYACAKKLAQTHIPA